MFTSGTLRNLRKGFHELKWGRWRWFCRHCIFWYAQTLLGCLFVSLADFLLFRNSSLGSWMRLTLNTSEQYVEATGEVRLYLHVSYRCGFDVVFSPLNEIFSSSDSAAMLSSMFSVLQVLHRVVILIFYWPTRISPLRQRSRYFHTEEAMSVPFWFCLVILFMFCFSPNSWMQLLNIWSPLALSRTPCPKETPSSWWGLCLCPLICL